MSDDLNMNATTVMQTPDKMVNARDVFGIDSDMVVKGFALYTDVCILEMP